MFERHPTNTNSTRSTNANTSNRIPITTTPTTTITTTLTQTIINNNYNNNIQSNSNKYIARTDKRRNRNQLKKTLSMLNNSDTIASTTSVNTGGTNIIATSVKEESNLSTVDIP